MIVVHQIWLDYSIKTQADALAHHHHTDAAAAAEPNRFVNCVVSNVPVPDRFVTCVKSWRSLADNNNNNNNNNNKHILWTTRTVAEFLRDHTSAAWTKLFWSLEYPVMRVDVARLLLVWHYGGIYADIDVSIAPGRVEHVDAVLNGLGDAFFWSPVRMLGASDWWFPNNDLFGCRHAHHPVVARLLDKMQTRLRTSHVLRAASSRMAIGQFFYILKCTGPLLMYSVYRETRSLHAWTVMPKIRRANSFAQNAALCDDDLFYDHSSASWVSFDNVAVQIASAAVIATLVLVLVQRQRARKRFNRRARK